MMLRVLKKIKNNLKQRRNISIVRGKMKYFCIGRNKTGTTSLKMAFEDLGYIVGDQLTAEKLSDKYYFEGNFSPIIEHCKSAQVFQDVPFSWPETFKHLDRAYPESKFILTVRDDPEQWYRSITQFHGKMLRSDGGIPTVDDLRSAKYVRKGFMYNTVRIHGTPDNDPYNKNIMIAHYESYNNEIMTYFKNRPDDLLIINIAKTDDYMKFVEFLNISSPYEEFPWVNKT